MRSALALLRYLAAMTIALLKRPNLVPTAVRQVGQMRANGWWRRPPFLPLPPRDYMEFRQVTATGNAEEPPGVDDTILWLEWCRSMRALGLSG